MKGKFFCNICNNSRNNKTINIKEMMIGLRTEFTYFECSKCGCIQIADIPKNMETYYPNNYCSFNIQKNNSIHQYITKKRDEFILSKKGLLGKLIYKVDSMQRLDRLLEIVGSIGLDHNSKILDVGCGNGELLFALKRLGFNNLWGADPFIDKEINEKNVKIMKTPIQNIDKNEKFDLIMFSHSLEHIPEQLETLQKASEILSEKGICIIRIPVKSNFIWDKYGVNWVQIDAPRHFFIHSIKSFEFLVEKACLSIIRSEFDSTEFQFWGSEQYLKDIPLLAENSYFVNPNTSIFSKEEIENYKNNAEELNREKLGDQATFYLKNI